MNMLLAKKKYNKIYKNPHIYLEKKETVSKKLKKKL